MYVKYYEKTNRNIILLDDSSISNKKMNLDDANALVEEIVLDETYITSSDSEISLDEEIIISLDSDISLDEEIMSDSKISIDSEIIISDSEISISGSEIPLDVETSDSETLIDKIFSTSDLEYSSENINSEVFPTDEIISSENDIVSDKEIATDKKITSDEETMLDAETLFETILNDFNQLADLTSDSAETGYSLAQVYKSLIDRFHHPLAVISYLLENERMLCNKELILSENANPRTVSYINAHFGKMSKFYGNHKNDNSSDPKSPSPCNSPLNFDQISVPLLSQNLLNDDSTITSFDLNYSANCVSQDQSNVSPPKCSTVILSATSKVFKHSSHDTRKSLPSTSISSTPQAPCVRQPGPAFHLPTAVRSKPFVQKDH